MRSTSTIAIGRDTLELLKVLGKKGDTYDGLIRQLVGKKAKNSKNSPDDGFQAYSPANPLAHRRTKSHEQRNIRIPSL